MRAGICYQVRAADGRWVGSHREDCRDDHEDEAYVRQYQEEVRVLGEKYRQVKRDRFNVIAEVCDTCGLATDSDAHRDHCRS